MKKIEGYISFKNYQTWYCRIGECQPGKYPLLVLHGGPGMGHNYLKNLEALAQTGREVIFYDQLGCGKSSIPDGVMDWNVDIWEEELQVLRDTLGLTKVHILGQSWGGMLGMQYATHNPQGVLSMIVSSSPASMKLWASEAHRLIQLLPEKEKRAILKAEEDDDYTTEQYAEALDLYYARHMCRIVPNPLEVQESNQLVGEVYLTMQGPSEFTVTGKLKDWDITEDLNKIDIPVLLISGTDDEATPLIQKEIYERIPDCHWELLDGTHLVHVEQPEIYQKIVTKFIEEFEQAMTLL